MDHLFRIVDPNSTVEVFGIPLVGVNAESGRKLLVTLVFVPLVLLLGKSLRWLTGLALRGRENKRVRFWTRQGVRLTTALLMLIGLVSVWFDDPGRLAGAIGLFSAGLAFALQKVITALAG